MPAHWRLLKSRLEALCPTSTGNMWLRHYRNGAVDTEHPFLLQVSSYDRVGVLHGSFFLPFPLSGAFEHLVHVADQGNSIQQALKPPSASVRKGVVSC